jgi:hypothetical protein
VVGGGVEDGGKPMGHVQEQSVVGNVEHVG